MLRWTCININFFKKYLQRRYKITVYYMHALFTVALIIFYFCLLKHLIISHEDLPMWINTLSNSNHIKLFQCYMSVFFVISMDMLLFSFMIIEEVYLKNDVVLSLCKRYIIKTSSNLVASAATNVNSDCQENCTFTQPY